MSPGMMVFPVASMRVTPAGSFTFLPTASIRPFRTNRVPLSIGGRPLPSMMRAPIHALPLSAAAWEGCVCERQQALSRRGSTAMRGKCGIFMVSPIGNIIGLQGFHFEINPAPEKKPDDQTCPVACRLCFRHRAGRHRSPMICAVEGDRDQKFTRRVVAQDR